jgi:translation elongation factor EF-4
VFIECSAKTKLGIQQAFEELVTKVRDSKHNVNIFFDQVVMTKTGFANYKNALRGPTQILETPSLYEKETKATGTVSMNQDSEEQQEGVCSYC